MKGKQCIGWSCLWLFLCITGVSAQTDSALLSKKPKYATFRERDNWFISASAGGQSFLSGKDKTTGIKGVMPLAKISAGRWFSHVFALRAGIDAGYLKDELLTYPTLSFRLDYMADLFSPFRYKPYRRVDLYGFLGMGYDYVASRPIDPIAEMLSLHVGLQLHYNVSRRISVFVEPTLKLTSDLLDGEVNATKRLMANATIGVTYRFGSNRFNAFTPGQYDVTRVKELTDQVNLLRKDIADKGGESLSPYDASLLYPDASVFGKQVAYYSRSFWDNTFVSAGISGAIIPGSKKSFGDIVPGGSLSAGKWISPLWGAQLNLNYGRAKEFDMHYGVVSGEFLLDVSTAIAGYNKDRLFSVVPLAGLGWAGAHRDGSLNGSLAFTAGLQGRFNVSSKLDVFAEGRGQVFADHFFERQNNECSHVAVSLLVGVAYKLNGYAFSVHDFVATEQVKDLNGRINTLRQELSRLEATSKEKEEVADLQPAEFLDETADGKLFIRIKFDSYSSHLDHTQIQSLNNVGSWLDNEKQVKINIIPFSDDSNNQKLDEILRMKRANVIMEILMKKHNIAPNRIEISLPEEGAYADKANSSAIILFIPELTTK